MPTLLMFALLLLTALILVWQAHQAGITSGWVAFTHLLRMGLALFIFAMTLKILYGL